MTRIVVRAADTALAMDEVVRQLGVGAYILSTRAEPGGIVIEAATDPAAASRPEISAGFAAELARHLPEPPLRCAVAEPAWLEAVAGELRGEAAGPLTGLRAVLPDGSGDWPAERIVLFGPVTEDLVLLAVRLAASFRQAQSECLPELYSYPRRNSLWAVPLQDWAQRLALPHRILAPQEAPPLPAAMPQLVVVPPDSEVDPAFPARWDSDLLCVLPWGLNPYRLARLTAPFRNRGVAACLTGIPEAEVPLPDDLLALSQAGMVLRLLCQGRLVLQSLTLPGAHHLNAWAAEWCARAGLSCDPSSKESAA